MRKFVLTAICSVFLAVVPVAAQGESAQGDVFRGTWTSVDTDGSNQRLDIQGAGPRTHAMFLFDDSATGACGGSPAYVQGSGMVDGDSLLMRGTLTCMPGGNPLRGRISVGFVYTPGADTLTDEFGVTWHRS